jgi:hypothetical protein
VTRRDATDAVARATHAHTAVRALSQRGAGVAMGVRKVHMASGALRSRVACARAAVVRVAAADDDDKPDTAREAISTGSELYKVAMHLNTPREGSGLYRPCTRVGWSLGVDCMRSYAREPCLSQDQFAVVTPSSGTRVRGLRVLEGVSRCLLCPRRTHPAPDMLRLACVRGVLTQAKAYAAALAMFEEALTLPGTGQKKFTDKPAQISDGERATALYNIACCQCQLEGKRTCRCVSWARSRSAWLGRKWSCPAATDGAPPVGYPGCACGHTRQPCTAAEASRACGSRVEQLADVLSTHSSSEVWIATLVRAIELSHSRL